MSQFLRISDADADDRFARFELIGWWEQARLARARVLLVGAGALGNEILKNLALLGVGNVVVVDFDHVENSNLSRSVLFREGDRGRGKAEVAAGRAREIYPQMRLRPLHANAAYDLGLGLYRWADVVLGGLDNREARVAINRAAARAGKMWIDGAIERLSGVARVFHPATGPCYECTMNETDWKILHSRRSCALLTREEMEQGKVPTTPTTASVIAGIQCQEMVKLLHGMDTLEGQGFVFDGMTHQSHTVAYTRKGDCPSHEADAPVETLPLQVGGTKVGDFLERVRQDLGPGAVIEASHDLLAALDCPNCHDREEVWTSLGRVTEEQGRCPRCGQPRAAETVHTIDEQLPVQDRCLSEIGIPAWDVLAGRRGLDQRFYEFAGDCDVVLGSDAALSMEDGLEEMESPGARSD